MPEIEILSAVHGIAPRSDELLRAGTDRDRGRISEQQYVDLLSEETEAWLSFQQQAGIDLYEDGKLAWQDHLRPIVRAADGFAPDIDDAPITRWFETNTFYRRPTITGELSLRKDADRFLDNTYSYLSLIAPGTFTELCQTNESETTLENVTSLYRQLLGRAAAHGLTRVTLVDYAYENFASLVLKPHIQAVTDLAKANPDIAFSYLQLGQAANTRTVPTTPPGNLGLQLSDETARNLSAAWRYRPFLPAVSLPNERWLPIIEGDTTVLETPALPDRDSPAIRGAQRIILTHTTDLQLLPLPYAQQKITQLAALTDELRAALGENS